MKIILAGLNHKKAPVDVREKLAFSKTQTRKALADLKERFANCEFALLSTCNRVEIYCACSKASGIEGKDLIEFLADFHTVGRQEFVDYFYVYNDAEAVKHLLTVSSSLDSMVVGEGQITGQVKESYKLACGMKSTGKILNRLFHSAFATSKKILTNTNISSGRVSVAGVAVELAMQLFADVSRAKVAVIGAGEMGELLIQHLLHSECKDITVVSRSVEHGLDMAKKYNIYTRKWEELSGLIAEADIVIASAKSHEYIFEEKTLREVIRQRRKRPLLVIDVAVPRNFAPDVNNIEDVFLYSIDELSEVAEQNQKVRQEDIAKGMAIIEENVSSFIKWFGVRDIGPVIGEMKEAFGQIGQKEIENFFAGQRQNASCREAMEAMTHRLVNRVLHCVIKNIDHVAQRDGADEAVKLANDMVRNAKEVLDDIEKAKQ